MLTWKTGHPTFHVVDTDEPYQSTYIRHSPTAVMRICVDLTEVEVAVQRIDWLCAHMSPDVLPDFKKWLEATDKIKE